MTLPDVDAGCLYALRLFEVAQSIDLATLANLPLPPAIHVRPGRLTFFGQLRSLLSVVHVGLRDVEIEPGEWVQAECNVLLFTFGVAVACFQMPTTPIGVRRGSGAASATDLAEWVARLNQNNTITTKGREVIDWLLGMTKEALDRPSHDPMHETYTIVSVQRFAKPCSIDEVLASDEVVRILLGESPEFTPATSFHQQIVSHQYRYGCDDLCIVDWDAAFIVDPKPNEDLIDLLALALTQLLEFQRFDTQLEQELKTLYNWKNELAPQWPWGSRAQRRVDMVNRLLIDIGEFVDRSANAFKITEDVYYA
jgi:hypothetical protein